MDENLNGWTDGWMDIYIYIYIWMEKQVDGWTNVQIDKISMNKD